MDAKRTFLRVADVVARILGLALAVVVVLAVASATFCHLGADVALFVAISCAVLSAFVGTACGT